MSNGHKHIYEFGQFAVDTSNRILLCDGEPVALQPKAFDTLLLLIERRGEVLTKDELLRQLWPDRFVEESNLSQNIYVLRKTLAQTAGGDQLIKTIPKRGYRFVGDVREIYPDDELLLEEHTWTRVLTEEEFEDEEVRQEKHISAPVTEIVAVSGAQQELALKPLIDRHWQLRTWQRFALAAFGVAVAVAAYMLWRASSRSESHRENDSRAAAFQSMTLKRLTDIGKVMHPAISPDGKYLVYVLRSEPYADSIWIKHMPTGGVRQIVSHAEGSEFYEAPIFSVDSSFVYYISREEGVNKLYRVAIVGDTPRKLIDDVWGRITLSPDGRQLAFVRVKWNTGEHTMYTADVDGSSERSLATRRSPEYFNVFGIGPAWSRDGKIIASSGGADRESNHDDLILIDVATGSQRLLSSHTWQSIGQLEWLPDGSGLLVPAKEKARSPQQIWQVSLPSGEARRITNDLNDYEMLSITNDGKLLIAQESEQVSNLWVESRGKITSRASTASLTPEHATQISFAVDRREGFYGIAWTRDAQIVYSSNAGGLYDIWIVKPDGSDAHRLTESTGESYLYPSVSPDGRYIVYSSDRTGENNIWRMDADGRNPLQLTHGTNEFRSSFSADGQWVFYDSGQDSVRRVRIDGGDSALVVTGQSSGFPVISPDGLLMAYTYYDEQQKERWRLGVMEIESKRLLQNFPMPFRCFRWMPATQALAYMVGTNSVSNLWSQPLAGGPPTKLTDFDDKRLYWFDWSPDGKYLAVARGQWSSDVVAISGL